MLASVSLRCPAATCSSEVNHRQVWLTPSRPDHANRSTARAATMPETNSTSTLPNTMLQHTCKALVAATAVAAVFPLQTQAQVLLGALDVDLPAIDPTSLENSCEAVAAWFAEHSLAVVTTACYWLLMRCWWQLKTVQKSLEEITQRQTDSMHKQADLVENLADQHKSMYQALDQLVDLLQAQSNHLTELDAAVSEPLWTLGKGSASNSKSGALSANGSKPIHELKQWVHWVLPKVPRDSGGQVDATEVLWQAFMHSSVFQLTLHCYWLGVHVPACTRQLRLGYCLASAAQPPFAAEGAAYSVLEDTEVVQQEPQPEQQTEEEV